MVRPICSYIVAAFISPYSSWGIDSSLGSSLALRSNRRITMVRRTFSALTLALLSSTSILADALNVDLFAGDWHQSCRADCVLGLGNLVAAATGGLSCAARSQGVSA